MTPDDAQALTNAMNTINSASKTMADIRGDAFKNEDSPLLAMAGYLGLNALQMKSLMALLGEKCISVPMVIIATGLGLGWRLKELSLNS